MPVVATAIQENRPARSLAAKNWSPERQPSRPDLGSPGGGGRGRRRRGRGSETGSSSKAPAGRASLTSYMHSGW